MDFFTTKPSPTPSFFPKFATTPSHTAENSSSGAYGIPQSLPARKMATFGADYRTNPITQIKWGLWYIEQSYGTPCGAWEFWNNRYPHWY